MKRGLGVILVTLFVFVPFVFAQESGKTAVEAMMRDSMMSGGSKMKQKCMSMMQKNKRKMGMNNSCKMMLMKSMMAKQLVPTEDGGVILMCGNKLYKYDKNLELIKEVEIKVDMDKMKDMMMKMRKTCSMMGKSKQNTEKEDMGLKPSEDIKQE
ncbi:MAG: hypothetical protein ABIH18_05585 [Candidatus Omnitrophota bacterium]